MLTPIARDNHLLDYRGKHDGSGTSGEYDTGFRGPWILPAPWGMPETASCLRTNEQGMSGRRFDGPSGPSLVGSTSVEFFQGHHDDLKDIRLDLRLPQDGASSRQSRPPSALSTGSIQTTEFHHTPPATYVQQITPPTMSVDEKQPQDFQGEYERRLSAQLEHIEQADIHEPDSILHSIEDTGVSTTVWLVAACVSVGGFLFGYDTGYISSVLVTLGKDLGGVLSANQEELITSITSGGAFIGAIFAGLTADHYGRKLAIYAGCALFIIGAILQAAAFSLAQMTVGRLVVGLGVGSAAMIVPLYIGELAPARYRGRMIALENCCVAGGQFIAYCIGAGFAEVSHGWRYMVAIGAIPAILLAISLRLCPESTRQLVAHGRTEEADAVLLKLYPTSSPEQRTAKIKAIELSIHEATASVADKSLWWTYKQLHVVPSNFRAMVTACTVMGISQLGGFNTLMYYSGTLFSLVGFNKPVAVSIVVGAANFLFGFFNVAFVDKFGRRRILQITVLGMALMLTLAAVAFHYIPISKDLTLEATSVNWAGILVLVTIIFYVAFFSSGVAPIAWIGTELLPIEVRALGTMVNTGTCWATNLIIASTFLSMMKSMTPSGAFGFYAGICYTGFILICFFYPECKGMPLEAIREVYSHGFGVKYARQWQKDNMEVVKRRRSSVSLSGDA